MICSPWPSRPLPRHGHAAELAPTSEPRPRQEQKQGSREAARAGKAPSTTDALPPGPCRGPASSTAGLQLPARPAAGRARASHVGRRAARRLAAAGREAGPRGALPVPRARHLFGCCRHIMATRGGGGAAGPTRRSPNLSGGGGGDEAAAAAPSGSPEVRRRRGRARPGGRELHLPRPAGSAAPRSPPAPSPRGRPARAHGAGADSARSASAAPGSRNLGLPRGRSRRGTRGRVSGRSRRGPRGAALAARGRERCLALPAGPGGARGPRGLHVAGPGRCRLPGTPPDPLGTAGVRGGSGPGLCAGGGSVRLTSEIGKKNKRLFGLVFFSIFYRNHTESRAVPGDFTVISGCGSV